MPASAINSQVDAIVPQVDAPATGARQSLKGFPDKAICLADPFVVVDAVDAVDATQVDALTVAEAVELTGKSKQALHKRLSADHLLHDRICSSGPNKGRAEKIVHLVDLFRAYPAARATYEARQTKAQQTVVQVQVAQAEAQADSQAVAGLKDWQRRVMDARLAILAQIDAVQADRGCGRDLAVALVIAQAVEGRLPEDIQALVPLANARKGQSGSRLLSRRSIYRWAQELKAGKAALAPKAKGFVEPRWAKHLLGLFRQPQKPSLAQCVAELAHLLPSDISAPSYQQARRYLDKVGNVERHRGRMLPRELKNLKPFKRRDTEVLGAPLVCVTADGHTFDAEVQHPFTGRPFRPEITTVLDLYTRKVVGVSVGLAESAFTVMEALRHCCLAHGIPALMYVDNGSGYRNQWVAGVMQRIGCTMTHSVAYNSQARGCIERVQKTIWVDLGAKKLRTYMGAQMDREARQVAYKAVRKGQEGALIPWQDFVDFARATLEAYNNRPHKELPWTVDDRQRRVRMSPSQAWTLAVEEGFQPVLCTDSLDELLPMLERKVARGELNLNGNRYFSRELEEFNGELVRAAFDPWDVQRVWIRDREGRFLCEAQLDGNKTPYFPQPYILKALEERQRAADQRAEAKRARRRDLPTVPGPKEIVAISPEEAAKADAYAQESGLVLPTLATAQPAPATTQTPEAPRWKDRAEYAADVLAHPDRYPAQEVQDIQIALRDDFTLRLQVQLDYPSLAPQLADPAAGIA